MTVRNAAVVFLVLVLSLALAGPSFAQPPIPAGPYLETPEVPDFRFKVRISSGGSTVAGTQVSSCIDETLCVAGALPDRAELFLRIIGPRPNGFLWTNLVRLTPSEVEVWVEQRSTGARKYYRLPALPRTSDRLDGRLDRQAFTPSAGFRSTPQPTTSGSALPQPIVFVPAAFPDYRFTVRIFAGGQEIAARQEADCLAETVCISGAAQGRSELFLRLIGPRPNDFFHVNLVRFTPSRVRVTIDRLSTGESRTYILGELPPGGDVLGGRLDREAFAVGGGDGLPPDPGPANDRTLEGIDSDGDGLRDDVQRFIALNYGQGTDTTMALRQSASALQEALVEANDNGEVNDEAEASGRALECLLAVRGVEGRNELFALLSEVIDTEERLAAYDAYNTSLRGDTFSFNSPDQWAASCEFAPQSAALRQEMVKALSAKQECEVADEVTVFYTNGVFTSLDEACTQLLTLQKKFYDRYPARRGTVEFKLAYNKTHSLLDAFEAVGQYFDMEVSPFFRFLVTLVRPRSMPILVGVNLFTDAMFAVAAGTEASTTAAIQREYEEELLVGKKVIAVGHSQGNFFINRVHQRLDNGERQGFGAVAVATPSGVTAGDGPHTTLSGDRVIALIPGARAWNVDDPGGDFLGHGFLTSYLASGKPGEARILNDLATGIDAIQPPSGTAQDGIITVTLTWGDEPDVDLHMFEPDGTQVYYRNRSGSVGFLDVDDTSAFGPEHYFARCEDFSPGTYRVGVNYFRGSGPEVAQVNIEAGLINRSYAVNLPAARGSSGNSTPIPVATIVVGQDARGNFTFQVFEGW